jgi:TP901-1 family phage major tail protein
MAETAGRLVNLFKGTVAAGTLVATARTKSMAINREPIDVTSDSSDAWRTLLSTVGSRSVDITIEGVVDLAARTFLADALAETLDVYTLEWADGSELTGTFALGNYEESGEHTSEVTFSTTLASSGTVVLT